MSSENPTVDQIPVDDSNEPSSFETNLKSRSTWLRALFMAIYCVVVSLVGMVGSVIVFLGFCWVLFTGRANEDLKSVGQSLAAYIHEIVLYLTFNTQARPFPFGNKWPAEKATDE
jgi:hypothetical protein